MWRTQYLKFLPCGRFSWAATQLFILYSAGGYVGPLLSLFLKEQKVGASSFKVHSNKFWGRLQSRKRSLWIIEHDFQQTAELFIFLLVIAKLEIRNTTWDSYFLLEGHIFIVFVLYKYCWLDCFVLCRVAFCRTRYLLYYVHLSHIAGNLGI
jgi:hypothetical protein